MKEKNFPASDEKRERIYGLETEYGLFFLDDQYEKNWERDVHPVLPEKIESLFLKILAAVCQIRYNQNRYSERLGTTSDFFSRNGSRIYLDIGQHPEISTPECKTLREVVLYDKAGERILEKTLKKTNRLLRRINKSGTENNCPLWLVKNNRHRSETYGCHENYLVSRRTPYREELADLILPFLITRQIFCGAGAVTKNGFEISQRSGFLREIISGLSRELQNNQPSRALIHIKDSDRSSDELTLADSRQWRRIHLILGDSNMSEYSAWLKLGTTALILRMVEDNFFSSFCEIIDPIGSCHRISRDPACRLKNRITVKNESTCHQWLTMDLTAAQIQELYLEKARDYLSRDSANLPAENLREFRKITEEWEEVLKKIKTDPMLLKKEIDWVIKKNLLEKFKERQGLDWGHPDLKFLDIFYHHIDRSQGLYYLLESEGEVKRIFEEEEIKKAEIEPPKTRAKWRAAVIELLEKSRIPYCASWNEISFPGQCGGEDERYFCLDPFYSNPPGKKTKFQKPIEIP